MYVFEIILILVLVYCSFNAGYLLLFSIAGVCRRPRAYNALPDKRKIAVLIPAYKEDKVIIETARAAVNHDYPGDLFDVYIIADQLREDTLEQLSRLAVELIPVSFSRSTKARSIKYALTRIPDHVYDIVVILDADNIMGSGCLEKLNHAFARGFRMVQLHRTAKNRNTPTAILDAASEEINNHIFRQGHRAFGISSALIGSGMGFDFVQFKTLVMETDMEDNPGEDREIYLEMLRQGTVCEYIQDALVYDEKVQTGRVLEKQRTRWISAQLQYAVRFWIKEPLQTISGNIHYRDYALQTLLLPRVLMLGFSLLLFLAGIILHAIEGADLFPDLIWWIAPFCGCMLSLVISLYKKISIREIMKGVSHLPSIFFSFLKATVRSKHSQTEFIHTPKDYSSIGR